MNSDPRNAPYPTAPIRIEPVRIDPGTEKRRRQPYRHRGLRLPER